LSTTVTKFGATSLYFDGTGDWLLGPTSSTNKLLGDFTIEFWLYKLSGSGYSGIVCIGDYTNGILFRYQPNSNITDSFYLAGKYYNWNATTNCPKNQWNHIAIVRKNGYFSVYVNGSKVLSGYNNADLGSTQKLTIGASSHNAGEGLNGYIDGLKIVKGKALYTNDFVVPSSAPTTSTSSVSAGVTRLLLNFTGENNSTTFTDSSSDARTVTSTNVVISTTQSKPFGGSSGYFNGSSYIQFAVVNASNNLILFDDFTVEFWVYPDSDSNFSTGYTLWFGLSGGSGDYLGIKDGSYVAQFGGTGEMLWSGTPSLSTWTHIALVRSGSVVTLYVNGTSLGNKINSTFWLNNTSLNIQIGAFASNFYTKGYIDDFRIVKGKSLYNYNFTPPSSQLTNYP
jgi:hypothetical protein